MTKQVTPGLAGLLAAINKQYAAHTIGQLKDRPIIERPVISTGSIGLDMATGVGGIPLGTIAEIFGGESSGKTTLCLQVIAAAQSKGIVCAFIDAEHALDIKYAKNLGVDVGSLILAQPDYGEQALDIARQLITSGEVKVVVVDSVAAMVPKAELEGEIGDSHMGLQARLMSQSLRMLTGAVSQQNAVLVFINQTRMKIGVFFGSPLVTAGGNALKFYATMRFEVARIGKLKGDGDDANPTGSRTRVKVVKNKASSPFREAEYDLVYGRGVCRATECFELGVGLKLVQKAGAWFSYEDQRWQGKPKAVAALRADPVFLSRLEAEVRLKMVNSDVVAVSDDVVPDPVVTSKPWQKAPTVSAEEMVNAFVTHGDPDDPETAEATALGLMAEILPETSSDVAQAPAAPTTRRRRGAS